MLRVKTTFLVFLLLSEVSAHAASDKSFDADLAAEIEREIENAEGNSRRSPPRVRNQVRRQAPPPQIEDSSFFRIAPVAGYVHSEWDGATPDAGQLEGIGGFVGGVAILLGRDRLNYETGIQYASRGSLYEGALKNPYGSHVSTTGASIETTAHYIEIPAFLRFDVVRMPSVQMFLRGGATGAVLVGSDTNISRGSSAAIPYTGAADINDVSPAKTLGVDLESTDWRWAVGAGANVQITNSMSWTIDGLYERSIVEIGKSGDEEAYLSGFAVRTGLLFNL